MTKNKKVLILDDDQSVLKLYAILFKKLNIETICTDSIEKAGKELIENDDIGILISDYQFPNKTTASEFLRGVHSKWPNIPIILLTGLELEKIQKDDKVYYDVLFFKKKPITKDYIVFLVTSFIESNNFEIFNDFKYHHFEFGEETPIKIISKKYPNLVVSITYDGRVIYQGISLIQNKKIDIEVQTLSSMIIVALKYAGIMNLKNFKDNLMNLQKNKKFTSDAIIADIMGLTRQTVQRKRSSISEKDLFTY